MGRGSFLWRVPVAVSCAAALAACGGAPAPDGGVATRLRARIEGAWTEVGGSGVIRFEPHRMSALVDGRLVVRGIEAYDEAGRFVMRESGLLGEWAVTLDDDVLRLEHDGESSEYRRLEKVPPELVIEPLRLGERVELPPVRVAEIRRELAVRSDRDREVRENPARAADAAPVASDNSSHLTELVREVGWIDAARFGGEASGNAVVIVKHGGELPLMMAALPQVEDDCERSRLDCQLFSILYDGLQIRLGRKQRYGTQIGRGADGNPMILPLVDPENVDRVRAEIGLVPLAEYLRTAREFLSDGRKIRMPREGE